MAVEMIATAFLALNGLGAAYLVWRFALQLTVFAASAACVALQLRQYWPTTDDATGDSEPRNSRPSRPVIYNEPRRRHDSDISEDDGLEETISDDEDDPKLIEVFKVDGSNNTFAADLRHIITADEAKRAADQAINKVLFWKDAKKLKLITGEHRDPQNGLKLRKIIGEFVTRELGYPCQKDDGVGLTIILKQ